MNPFCAVIPPTISLLVWVGVAARKELQMAPVKCASVGDEISFWRIVEWIRIDFWALISTALLLSKVGRVRTWACFYLSGSSYAQWSCITGTRQG